MKPNPDMAPENRQRGFWWLFITQFQGAFSDNVLKWLVISLITGMGFSNDRRDQLVGVVGALFALPFILFSMAGGYFADRFSKRSVTIGIKLFEIVVMLLALCGLAANTALPRHRACVFLDGGAQRAFRPVQIRPAPGTAAGAKTFLGQRRPRTRHIHFDYLRNRDRRDVVQNVCREAGLVRRGAGRTGGMRGSAPALRHQQGA